MKNEEGRNMNYYYESGHIGNYKGHQVWIIDYSNFYKEDTINSDDIWAVRTEPNQSIKLVLKGYEFGQMSHSGEVSLYRKEKPFNFYHKKEEKEVKKTPVVVEVKEEPLEISYSDYTQPVDMFFKNLKEWWGDLDKELKSV